MNKKLKLVVIAGLFVTAFWLGRLSVSYRVITYSVDGYKIAFHRDWPTYGLPMAEYQLFLTRFRNGHTNEAIDSLESCLDAVVYDATCRRPQLRGEDLKRLDKCLAVVARYRKQYPRAAIVDLGLPLETPERRAEDALWSSNRIAQVDALLREVAKQSDAP